MMKSVFLLLFATAALAVQKLDIAYQWKYVDFIWESAEQKYEAIKNGDYDFKKVLPMDSKKDKDGRVFISFIGLTGSPVRLGKLTKETGPSGPLVAPYPDWSWFKKEDCNGITSVIRMELDECNRLWVLDAGATVDSNFACEAQILVFDLNTDKLVQRVKIPKEISHNKQGVALLTNIVVETDRKDMCKKTSVYVADTFGHGLIVWNDNKLTRLENPLFLPVKNATKLHVGSVSIDFPYDGILGMALSPKKTTDEPRYLYFRALSSFDLYYVSTDDLKNSKDGSDLKILGEKNLLDSQAAGQKFSSDGVLFFSPVKEAAIACWNRYTQLNKDNIEIVAQDPENILYVNQMQIVPPTDNHPEEIWALVNKYPYFALGKLNYDEYNFKILTAPVKKLIAGTKCSMEINKYISRNLLYLEIGQI